MKQSMENKKEQKTSYLSQGCRQGGLQPSQFLTDQLTLSQPGGAHHPHPVLQARPLPGFSDLAVWQFPNVYLTTWRLLYNCKVDILVKKWSLLIMRTTKQDKTMILQAYVLM